VEVHRQGHWTLFIELNLSEKTPLFRLVSHLSESKPTPYKHRFCQLVGLWSDKKIDIAIGSQTFLRVKRFRERLTLQDNKWKVMIRESRCDLSQRFLMVQSGSD
jgi:hypothetical protein